MNKMKKIAEAGYTLEVTSWENDGDNYATHSATFKSKEEAVAVRDMAEVVFQSCNNGDGGIGNANDSEEIAGVIINYLLANPKLVEINNIDITNEDSCEEMIMDYNSRLMGYSEWYYSRVLESAELYYVKEDVYAEKI